MAGELTALGGLQHSAIAVLAATESLAAQMFWQKGESGDWSDATIQKRNAYRQIAARLLIEHHNEAPTVNALVTPDHVKAAIPLDD